MFRAVEEWNRSVRAQAKKFWVREAAKKCIFFYYRAIKGVKGRPVSTEKKDFSYIENRRTFLYILFLIYRNVLLFSI